VRPREAQRSKRPGAELHGEVVIIAVYYPGALETVRELGDRLTGKVVVDISNPLNQTFDGLATPPGTSAAEEVAATAPAGARVVKAFNTTFSGTLVEGQVAGEPLDVLIAGDDEEAKERVAQLVRDGGCGPSTWVLWTALGSLPVRGSSG
jgi:8-hydroxy-5-deazaflavin:NADPH oxidoreductase